MAHRVAGDLAREIYIEIDGQMLEIKRQLRQTLGYPFDMMALRRHLQDAVEGRFPATNGTSNWPIWKTLMIGSKTAKQLREELAKGGFRVSELASDIMGNPAFTTLVEPVDVPLVRIKVRDLGFTEMPTITQFFARAKERGLDLCPAEVGPHLRLAFKEQPNGDWCWIAMNPISASGGGPNVFRVGRRSGGGHWLDTYYADPGGQWDLGDEIVFRSCK